MTKSADDRFAAPLQICFQGYFQRAFPLAAVNGQHTMGRNFCHWFGISGVHLIDRVGTGFAFRFQNAVHQQKVAQGFAQRRGIGHRFRDDIGGTLQGVINSVYPFFRIDEWLSQLAWRKSVFFLCENGLAPAVLALFPGR